MSTNEIGEEASPRLTNIQLTPPQLFATASEIDALDMWSDAGAYLASVWDALPDTSSGDLYNNLSDNTDFMQFSSGDPFVCDVFRHVVTELPEDAVCHICLDAITLAEIDNLRKLKCAHWFHAKCIMPWLMKKQSCPTCRSKVTGLEW